MPKIWKTQQWPQDWKRSVFIPIPKKGNAKEFSNYCTIAFISHTSRVMLKIFQISLQQYMNCELQMFKLVFEKAEQLEINPTSVGLSKEQESSRKMSISALLTKPKPLTGWIKLKNSERDGNTRPPDLLLEKSVCRSGSNSQNWIWNNSLVPNKERSMSRLYIDCHPAYLTYMQSTSQETLGWMKHKMESRLPGKISITSDMQMTPPLWQKVKRNSKAS